MRPALPLLLVLLAGSFLAALAAAPPSDHLDSPYIDHYPRRDIGDLFVWTGETGGPAFLINLNPLTPPVPDSMRGLDPAATYAFRLDTDGDYVPDLSYLIEVDGEGARPDARQTLRLYRATGADADADVAAGELVAEGRTTAFDASAPEIITGTGGERIFVGPRQDPFFFNFQSVRSPVAMDLRFALGADGLPSDGRADSTFGPTNIMAVVLEVPELRGRAFNAWATTSADGHQQDRCGKSSVTAIFLPETPPGRNPNRYPYGGLKQHYNQTRPVDDVDHYRDAFAYRLDQVQVDSGRVDEVVDFFLPDVLRYDPEEPAGYPNGRDLAEDAVYWTIRYINPFMVVTDSTLGLPQTNPQPLTATFPYAAPPLTAPGVAQADAAPCPWWHLLCRLRGAFAG